MHLLRWGQESDDSPPATWPAIVMPESAHTTAGLHTKSRKAAAQSRQREQSMRGDPSSLSSGALSAMLTSSRWTCPVDRQNSMRALEMIQFSNQRVLLVSLHRGVLANGESKVRYQLSCTVFGRYYNAPTTLPRLVTSLAH